MNGTEDLRTAAEAFLAEVADDVWAGIAQRCDDGRVYEAFLSWRCPSADVAEALEAALGDAGLGFGAAPPHAEARGQGYGVAARVEFPLRREDFDAAVSRAVDLGARHGAVICALGTSFDD